jgi:ABC-type multidrug transport system fused ATPase/permease subunit
MPILDIFWTMLVFFLFVIWIWILITVFADIFRNHEMNGGVKALWVIFVIFLPFLGVLVYIIANGHKMQERAMASAAAQEKMNRQYIQEAAGTAPSAADELTKLKGLHDSGVLTDAEFNAQKAKLLA